MNTAKSRKGIAGHTNEIDPRSDVHAKPTGST